VSFLSFLQPLGNIAGSLVSGILGGGGSGGGGNPNGSPSNPTNPPVAGEEKKESFMSKYGGWIVAGVVAVGGLIMWAVGGRRNSW